MFGLMPTVFMLVAAETSARILLFLRHGRKVEYLVAPFGKSPAPAAPVEYPLKPEHNYTKKDWCTGRAISFTVNQYGGRGRAWSPDKPPGRFRIAVVGASTTFGVNNPDDQTWPSLLEDVLRARYGEQIEVLNAGVPGMRLEEMVRDLPSRVLRHHPDLVLYYEAFNNAIAYRDAYHQADINIGRFHEFNPVGRLARLLHYRSMLYTYLLEKVEFVKARRSNRIVPEIAYFRGQLERLVEQVRRDGVPVIFVLQVTDLPPDARAAHLDLNDTKAVERFILAATQANKRPIDEHDTDQRFITLRVYQTQVLVELARRTAEALNVPVIDPRPAFEQYAGGERLFCDVIHLTDAGNRVLAEAVGDDLASSSLAGTLHPSVSQRPASPSGG